MNKQFFYCYSPVLKRALLDNGFRYLHKGLNDSTGKSFWVFENAPELIDYKDNKYQVERDNFKQLG